MKKAFILLCVLGLWACQDQPKQLTAIEGKQIQINDSINKNPTLEDFIEPYRKRIKQEMEGQLAYTPKAMYKSDYKLNTPIGNLMADAVMEMATPLFVSKTGEKIDLVLLNYGGIRSGINTGDISTKTAYDIMPFENKVAVAALTSDELKALIEYLVHHKTAHPIAGFQVILDAQGHLSEVKVNGEDIQQKTYYVATSDYLVKGGDGMDFFTRSKSVTLLDYKLRNLFIDYFKSKDTINPVRDERFYQLEL